MTAALHEPGLLLPSDLRHRRGSSYNSAIESTATAKMGRSLTTVRRKAPPKLTPDLFKELSVAEVAQTLTPPDASPGLKRTISMKTLNPNAYQQNATPNSPMPSPLPMQPQFILKIDTSTSEAREQEAPGNILKLLGPSAVAQAEPTTKRSHFHWRSHRDRRETDAKKPAAVRRRGGDNNGNASRDVNATGNAFTRGEARQAKRNDTGNGFNNGRSSVDVRAVTDPTGIDFGKSARTGATWSGTLRSLPFFKGPTQVTTQGTARDMPAPNRTAGLSRSGTKRFDISFRKRFIQLGSGSGASAYGKQGDTAPAPEQQAGSSQAEVKPVPMDRTLSTPLLRGSSPQRSALSPSTSNGVFATGGAHPPISIPLRTSSYSSDHSSLLTPGLSPEPSYGFGSRKRQGSNSSQISLCSSSQLQVPATPPLRPARSVRRPAPPLAGRATRSTRINIADEEGRKSLFAVSPNAGPKLQVTIVDDETVSTVLRPTEGRNRGEQTGASAGAAVGPPSRMSRLIADTPLDYLDTPSSGSQASAKAPSTLPDVRDFETQLQRSIALAYSRHHLVLARRATHRRSRSATAMVRLAEPRAHAVGAATTESEEESSDEAKSLSDIEGWQTLPLVETLGRLSSAARA
ncbi:hypothetical protein ACQY0O_000913 [Thecaphora frezii]